MADKESIIDFVSELKPVGCKKDLLAKSLMDSAPRISTGWLSIDIALSGGLSNELYIMAAETSTGKSAFMMDMAQNISLQGVNVLYFALEMGTEEFLARAISSASFMAHVKDKTKRRFTAGEILYWSYDQSIEEFVKVPYSEYSQYADEYFEKFGDHLYIIEAGLQGFCARDIANIATLFKKRHPDEPVVVIIDYLQILKADKEDRAQTDRKTKTDVTVTTLKTLASQIGMPVFTVSSVPRSNYSGKISTAAFKESGDTEYTGGVLIGWNWHGVTDTSDEKRIDTEKKACAERGFRRMEFDVLKYRNSQRDHVVRLVYFPAYNYFIDVHDWHPDVLEISPFEDWDGEAAEEQTATSDTKKKSSGQYKQEILRF